MAKPTHVHLADLRGFQRLANDAVVGLTDLVEAMHATVAPVPGKPGAAARRRTGGITGFVYRSVRGVTRLVGGSVDALLGALAPVLGQRPPSPEREAVVAALNGVLGDYLAASGNALAIPMTLRAHGKPLRVERAALAAAFPDPGRKLLLLAHGLCMNDLQWQRSGHDHGTALARDLGYTPLYLHYNSGLHVAANGRALAALLETLVREWPHPIERFAIVGHSMGGLVARSACAQAAGSKQAWLSRLDDLVCLGTPHFGAPLERAGAWVDYLLGTSRYTAPFARLGKVRSAGIRDLRHGAIRDDEAPAADADRPRRREVLTPLPAGVRCFAIAASRQAHAGSSGTPRGDGLVPVASALGWHRDEAHSLAFAEDRRFVAYGTGHFELLDRPEVYRRLRDWLAVQPSKSGAG
jgi:pimeloyl-ACP methyl ester carboxylesterase